MSDDRCPTCDDPHPGCQDPWHRPDGYEAPPAPSCATCRHWTEDPEARDSHLRWPDLYPTTTGECSQAGQYAWATGVDVDASGLSTPPDFACTLYEETP